jgi:hypothetical protein
MGLTCQMDNSRNNLARGNAVRLSFCIKVKVKTNAKTQSTFQRGFNIRYGCNFGRINIMSYLGWSYQHQTHGSCYLPGSLMSGYGIKIPHLHA